MKISIIIPCYNEERYIIDVLKKVNSQKKNFKIEIIIVDDCSTDNTIKILKQRPELYDKIIISDQNKGKGNAIKLALPYITGDITLIQDADLEYNPEDYPIIFAPFFEDNADIVFGTRFNTGKKVRIFYYLNRIANFIITTCVNFLTNINFSDVETGFKAFKTEHLKRLNLKENSFAIEIEITMKLAKIRSLRIYEVGISYSGRTYEEGKKIKMSDGFKAIYSIIKYKFWG
ncbi:glycosyltransferase family 2 protein [Pelagibacterales bacterium SAG-MED02]|nr:glycosyltransferase family 2 protein [Pelagibacterales bacterium SAG-MED02]